MQQMGRGAAQPGQGRARGTAGSGCCPGLHVESPRRSWAGIHPQLQAGRGKNKHFGYAGWDTVPCPAQGEAPGHGNQELTGPTTCMI